MTRQELQAALKEFRNQSLTEIALNAKTDLLQTEYDRIVEEQNSSKQETTVTTNKTATTTTNKKDANNMVKYLVTTRLEVLETVSSGCQVFMVDGTVPGWKPSENDYHFDHHKQGGADIQIDEMPNSEDLLINPDLQGLIVTTQVDADACVAAAWLQIDFPISEKTKDKLRAIAYDCDHLGVPSELSHLSDFAAQCVAAMKSDSDALISELNLPKDRKTWTIEQKEEYASLAFQRGTESLIAACKGERKFPGELGEAKEYWEKVETNTLLLLDTQRVYFYRDTFLVDLRGLEGVDPRCGNKAYEWLKTNYGHECKTAICLTIMDRWDNGVKTGFKYTLAVIALHPRVSDLDYTKGTFEALTISERKINPNADGWGGRKTVGGSGWNTPSQLKPEEVIDIVLNSL